MLRLKDAIQTLSNAPDAESRDASNAARRAWLVSCNRIHGSQFPSALAKQPSQCMLINLERIGQNGALKYIVSRTK